MEKERSKKYVVLEHLMLPDRGLRFYSINGENNTHGLNGELWYKEVGFVDTPDEAQKIIQQMDSSLLPTWNELYEYHKNKDIPNEIKVGDIVTPKQLSEVKSVVKYIDTSSDDVMYILENNVAYTKDELETKQHPLNGSQTYF